MIEQPNRPRPILAGGFPFLAAIVLIAVIFACSIYANLSFTVTNRVNLKYIPPFKPYVDGNDNHHLGAEYFNIARSLRAGKGFSNPFNELESGPTAWMPPVLPAFLATLLWAFDGDRDLVLAAVVFAQVYALIATGVLALLLARQTTRLWTVVVLTLFVGGVLCDFRLWFQNTHDCWLVLLAVDLLLAGVCWLRPLESMRTAAGWGFFGGFCALINPLVAFSWGIATFLIGFHRRTWSRFGVAVLVAGLTLTPWTVRNYLVFGRLFPVKPNLAFELYQSQCLQSDGLLQGKTFGQHPNNTSGVRERREYKAMGEMAYLDHKREQFWQAVRAKPYDFIERIFDRFLGATLWYESMDRSDKVRRPWVFWISRVTHPLPFLAVLGLILTAVWKPLPWPQWAGIGIYLFYLFPYIAISYYERYAMPLLAVKVLLVVWAVDAVLCLVLGMLRPTGAGVGRSRSSAFARRSDKAVPASS